MGPYEFGDPQIAAADNSSDLENAFCLAGGSALLNVAPAADPFAGLRIMKHCILVVDIVLSLEIVRVRSIPMAL